jgi:hypothetical protein
MVGRVADAATGPGLFAAPGRHAVAPLAVGKKRWRPPALRLLVPRAGVSRGVRLGTDGGNPD